MLNISDQGNNIYSVLSNPSEKNMTKKKKPISSVSQILQVDNNGIVIAPKQLTGNVTYSKNFGRKCLIAAAAIVGVAILIPFAKNGFSIKRDPELVKFDESQADNLFSEILRPRKTLDSLNKNKHKESMTYENEAYFKKNNKLEDEGIIDLDLDFDFSKATKFYDEFTQDRLSEQPKPSTFYSIDKRIINEPLEGKGLQEKIEYLGNEIPGERDLRISNTSSDETFDADSLLDTPSSIMEMTPNCLPGGKIEIQRNKNTFEKNDILFALSNNDFSRMREVYDFNAIQKRINSFSLSSYNKVSNSFINGMTTKANNLYRNNSKFDFSNVSLVKSNIATLKPQTSLVAPHEATSNIDFFEIGSHDVLNNETNTSGFIPESLVSSKPKSVITEQDQVFSLNNPSIQNASNANETYCRSV